MQNQKAIDELKALKAQADTDPQVQTSTPEHDAWKAKAVRILELSIGANTYTTKQFREMSYTVGIWTGSPGEDARDAQYFRARVKDAAALLDAAIYELELDFASNQETSNFDPGLWDHVKHSVEEERWSQVASAAVIYVEDKVRRWAGSPTDKEGRKLVGKDLFLKALAADGALSLGSQVNEQEGWRMLGSGMISALGNVDRHNIQERVDLRRYAMGVVGLASLVLTQIRHQHPALAS